MKTKKTIKIIGILILIMVMIMLVIAGYFIFVDIESKVPEEVQESCHLEVKEYKNRKIFIITPKEETTNPLKILYFHGGSYVAEASKDHWNFIQKIVEIVKITLEKTPPELASDIMEKGIVLAGGGALIKNLDKLLSIETGMPVYIAEEPLDCVVRGTGKTLEDIENSIN